MNVKRLVAFFMMSAIVAASAFSSGQTGETISEEKPVLRYLGYATTVDRNESWQTKMLEERTGYKVVYEGIGGDEGISKLNLILASGEEYDVIHYGDKFTLLDYVQKGGILPLNDLIDKYAPNISANMSDVSLDMFDKDGDTYVLPVRLSVDYYANHLFIRTDWLDAVGEDMPQTIDDFTRVLRKFKEFDVEFGLL